MSARKRFTATIDPAIRSGACVCGRGLDLDIFAKKKSRTPAFLRSVGVFLF